MWFIRRSLIILLALSAVVGVCLLLYNVWHLNTEEIFIVIPYGMGLTISLISICISTLRIWKLMGSAKTFKYIRIGLLYIIGIGITILVYYKLGFLLNRVLHLGISPWLTGSIAIICIAIVGGLIYGRVKKGFVFFLKSSGITLLVLMGISLIVALFISPKFAFLIARILAAFLCLVLIFIMAINLRPLWYAIKRLRLFSLQKFPPGSFKPEIWIERIEKSNPVKQKYLLLQTDHQSLSLTASEFLEVLIEILPLIKGDPVLSTYWEKRDQLEEVLRQERQG